MACSPAKESSTIYLFTYFAFWRSLTQFQQAFGALQILNKESIGNFPQNRDVRNLRNFPVGPLHEAVKWYEICPAEWQATQWDIQSKEKSHLAGKNRFVGFGVCCIFLPAWRIFYHVTVSRKEHITYPIVIVEHSRETPTMTCAGWLVGRTR